ncbi:MAG TPA: sigma-70 family RNA polymerase sigma factor [Candidatus Dormibacteraeota bacterium]|nr:sigma-70 family RNA polymerase sigma factor [Candidatus Dormibacteraeota bacterium]
MEAKPAGEVTRLLLEWGGGNEGALAALLPLVYEELRIMAARHLRAERQAHTLQRTALVHEAFLRLIDQKQVDWQGRSQFFAIASQMMRRILVDHARRRLAQKRGGNAQRLSLEDMSGDQAEHAAAPALDALALTVDPRVDLASIVGALKRLEAMDPGQGKLVELRFFGGLSISDTAQVLRVSPATVKREWAIARAWLQRELGTGGGG